jgi:hypothetical protein
MADLTPTPVPVPLVGDLRERIAEAMKDVLDRTFDESVDAVLAALGTDDDERVQPAYVKGYSAASQSLCAVADERDAARAERDAWRSGVAEVVYGSGWTGDEACGPADLLPLLAARAEVETLRAELADLHAVYIRRSDAGDG